MIKSLFTRFISKTRLLPVVIMMLVTSHLFGATINYICQCDPALPDGIIGFEITVTSGPGETWSLENIVNLYAHINPDIIIQNGVILPETPVNASQSLYVLSGLAYSGIMPVVNVWKDGAIYVNGMNMITCFIPDGTINGPAEVCRGETATLSISTTSNLTGDIDWSSPLASSINEREYRDTVADIVFPAVGTYSVTATGTSASGCPILETFFINVVDPYNNIVIEGPELLCYANNDNTPYNLSQDPGIDISWISPDAGVTFNPPTGSGSVTNVTFPDVEGTYKIIARNRNTDDCYLNVMKEVRVVDVIDTVQVIGETYVCFEETATYTIAQAGDYSNLLWTVTPGNPPGSGGFTMTPMSGSGSAVDVLFTSAGTFEVMVTGMVNATGCPFEASVNVTVADDFVESIACNNEVHVSLNNSCTLELTPDMILEGDFIDNDAYTITLVDIATGEVIDNPMLTQDQLGHRFMVTVTDKCGGNSCWGTILVEDKSITPLVCPSAIVPTTCYEFDQNVNVPTGLPDFNMDVTVTYRPATGDYLVQGHDNCSDVTMTYVDNFLSTNECANPQVLDRTWTITDVVNGLQSSCTTRIHINQIDGSLIQWPNHWDSVLDIDPTTGDDGVYPTLDACYLNNPPELACNTKDEFGNPHPDCTGYPSGLICENLQLLGYKDNVLNICGEAKKILRKWTVWDACNHKDLMYTQIITLMDNSKPVCTPPSEYAAYNEIHECHSDIIITPPTVTGECDSWTYTIEYKVRDEFGFKPQNYTNAGVVVHDTVNGVRRYKILDVPFNSDSVWVSYKVRDACGNVSDVCYTEIELVDNEQPIPACDFNNAVALNDHGLAYAGPLTFDDHSWDNCGIFQKVIQRMDPRCGCERPVFDFMYYLGEYNGHHYYLSKDKVIGPRAYDYTSAMNYYVAVINTLDENTWIRQQANNFTLGNYFIGYRGSSLFNLSWQSGQSTVSAPWAANEPSDQHLGAAKGDYFVRVNSDGYWNADRASVAQAYYVMEVEDPCGWTQKVSFCCNDLQQDVMVSMRVIDNFGNHNECMVNVNVQDFTKPEIWCPPHMTIDCDADYSDLSQFGEASATDVCNVTITELNPAISINDCKEGVIRRSFRAEDQSGNSVSCFQNISVVNNNDFDDEDIDWPDNYTITQGCSLKDLDPNTLPVEAAYPRWERDSFPCSSVTYTYEDLLFYYVDEACQKLIRHWTVIDWCQPNEYWTFDQVIKLMNTNGPRISAASCATSIVNGTLTNTRCFVDVQGVTAAVNANSAGCQDKLKWSYTIDFHNDGSINRTGSSNDASGTFEYGQHLIVWTVEDDCGNSDQCTKILNVRDNKAPTPYCQGDVVVPISDPWGVQIWASDLDLGTTDDCPSNTVVASFSENTIQPSLTFDCDDLPNGENVSLKQVRVWFWDNTNTGLANKDFCTVNIYLQDNVNACPDEDTTSTMAVLQGDIKTETAESVDEVEVTLMASMPEYPRDEMTQGGHYAFANVAMYNDYSVEAFRDDNHLNGVSTLDIVLIQRHILGIEKLDSPYKIIAADANNSSSVSAIDLVELRKLILGIYEKLPLNNSWRFVDAGFSFTDHEAPFPFGEVINYFDIDSDMNSADFVGVKIGDVNNSAQSNAQSILVDHRSSASFDLFIEKSIVEDQLIADIHALENIDLAGVQFTMTFDNSRYQLVDIVPAVLDIRDDNVAWQMIDKGVIAVSWHATGIEQVREEDLLFKMVFTSQTDDFTELGLGFADSPVRTEVYYDSNGSILTKHMDIDENVIVHNEGRFELLQNVPNPFDQETTIRFVLPTAGPASVSVLDMTGKLLYSVEDHFEAGYNEIELNQAVFNATGMLYYQLATETHTTTKKMIVLK